jgi:hypothetical protein
MFLNDKDAAAAASPHAPGRLGRLRKIPGTSIGCKRHCGREPYRSNRTIALSVVNFKQTKPAGSARRFAFTPAEKLMPVIIAAHRTGVMTAIV